MKINKINSIWLCSICVYAVDVCVSMQNNGLLLHTVIVFALHAHTALSRFLEYVYVYVNCQAGCTLEMSFPGNYGWGS